MPVEVACVDLLCIKFKRKLQCNVHAQNLKTRQVVLFVSALAERGLAIAEQHAVEPSPEAVSSSFL